ncbi:hypothetical protein GGF37_007327 [Kickxella alabastrina]|nr:hypothetical protein GGF37_007327 [Kickxella alabastrina]
MLNKSFAITILALALALPLGASFPSDSPAQPETCPLGVISCSTRSVGVDSCCSPTYGLLVLTQQWHTELGPSDEFTLHGLWPDTCSGQQTGNSGCDSSRLYTNITEIVKPDNSNNNNPLLLQNMNTYWSSYTGDNNKFWSHEWNKHGTCVTTLNPRCYGSSYIKHKDVRDYFNTALRLRNKYNLYEALSDKGIEPSEDTKYTAAEFKSAIKEGLGIEVAVKCKNGALSEIWAWFNVRDAMVYVPSKEALVSDSCPSTFIYPPKDSAE